MQRDITIIGAGSTGLSAAIFLEAQGYKPRVIEKRNRAPITKALGINPVTLKLMEPSGITQRFLANGRKLSCNNLWYKDQLLYRDDFSRVRHPYPFMIVQPQCETEQIMEDYLKEKGIVVERNYDLLHIANDGDSLDLQLEDCNSNSPFNIRTDGILLGADGGKSRVREEAGIAFNGWEHSKEYSLYDIELSTPLHSDEGHYRFFKEGAMLMLHIRDGVWRIAGNLDNMLDYLPKSTRTGKISWETTFTISERVAERYNKGNIYLLGDAAHIHSPIGAKGMNMCIEDSYVFSELLRQGREEEFSKLRRRKVKNAVGILGQLTEYVGGQHFIGNTIRSNMKRFSFLFPVFMPGMRKFLLGLK